MIETIFTVLATAVLFIGGICLWMIQGYKLKERRNNKRRYKDVDR